jgi:hypothetical protein
MNIAIAVLGALLASVPLLAAGYLLGVRRGIAARDAVRSELARSNDERNTQAQEVRRYQELLAQAERQLAVRPMAQPNSEPLKEQIDTSIKTLLQPLLTRDSQARELRDAVSGLLAPMVERERLGIELSRLDPALSGRGNLSQLLSAIATRAGFSTVLVSDNNGLPMGESDGAKQIDMLCATLGLLLNMVDRISSSGGSAPLAVVLRDADNQVALHRLFKVEGLRYVLTAISSGSFLSPDTLDPTLARIERVLMAKAPG